MAPLGIEIVHTGRTLSFVHENIERNPPIEVKEVILQSGIVVFSYDLF
ncbi:MAG: hypothetical protein QXE31_02915 [Candidatus Woesearchaeota archaeon]